MDSQPPTTAIETRRSERLPLDAPVTIEFAGGAIVGPGQNISRDGVYFTAEGSFPVTVRLQGREVHGHLIRFESMGGGRIGVAIRFDTPIEPPSA